MINNCVKKKIYIYIYILYLYTVYIYLFMHKFSNKISDRNLAICVELCQTKLSRYMSDQQSQNNMSNKNVRICVK